MESNKPSGPADCLGSEEQIVDYLNGWIGDGSPREIARALGDVARARGIVEIPHGAGRQPLYTGLSEDGNPTLETLTAVLDALGLELSVRKKAA